MFKKVKDKKIRIILILVCALILFMGASFAWLGIQLTGNSNVLKAGSLSLYLDESATEGINIEYAIPTSDNKGLSQEGYTFKLVNDGTVATNYVIYLDDLALEENETRMLDSVVKYSLTKNGEQGETTLLTAIGTNPERVVDLGTIEPNTTNTYTLKLWMDYNATNEVMDTVFYAKLRVEAEQQNIPTTKSDMVMNITETDKVIDLSGEDITNYVISSNDTSVATIDATTGVITPKRYGVVKFTARNKTTGEKKEITVTITKEIKVTYIKQTGAETIEKETDTCTLSETNQTSCSVTLPSITASEGYSVVGWNKEATAHTGETGTISVSKDTSLYTITKKGEITYTATFNKQENGIESIGADKLTCTIDEVYNGEEQGTTCEITLPEIKTTEGYTALGWTESKEATEGTAAGTKIELSSDKEYYTVIKKNSVMLSAKFYKNGSTSINGNTENEYVTISCELEEVYNGEIQKNECTITVPTIEASSATPTVLGFSENKDATVGSISVGQELTLTENKEYYAITKAETKTITGTFNLNGAASQDGETSSYVIRTCNIAATYNGESQAEGCSITSPKIVGSSATPTVIGYSDAADNHTSSWDQGTEKTIKEDAEYFAQTKKEKVTYKATYEIGSNVSSIGKESDTCVINETYNGLEQAKSCTIEAPSITAKEGYTSVGWSTEKGSTTGETTLTLSKDTTFYANASANSYVIEYYDGTELKGTTGAKVDEKVELTKVTDLGIEKQGYTFKGWTTTSGSTTVEYADGEEVTNLSKESGTTVKLYTVWADDIAPKCSFSTPIGTTTQNTTELTLTCIDEGTGIANSSLTASNFTINGSENGKIVSVGNPTEINGGYSYVLTLKGLSVGSFTVSLNANSLSDNSNNGNAKVTSEEITVEGRKYTVTYTKGEHIASITSTTDSCTTTGSDITCKINLPGITAEEGYSVAGWYEGNEKIGDANQKDVEISSDKELVAMSELEYYNFAVTISEGIESFDISGAEGTPLTGQTSYSYDNLYGTEITITNIKVKEGYTYTGYTLDGSLIEVTGSTNEKVIVKLGSNDGTIKLNSKINSYKVTYDATTNGGTTTATPTTVDYNKAIDLTPTATKEGFEFVGWNTNKEATTALSSLTMETADVTLYAIFKKEVTITFNKNGATSQTVNGAAVTTETVEVSCTLYNNGKCKVTSPSIEASANTPTVIGYSTSADDHTSSWNVSTEKEVTKNGTYYAQTKQDKTTKSVTYEAQGVGVNPLTTTADSCTIEATYNGESQEPSCKVKLPTFTVASGYTALGWNTNKTAITGDAAGTEITLTGSTTTYYTISRKDEITLKATFNKNGAASQTVKGGTASTAATVEVSCKLPAVYNTATQASECDITTPVITASTATPTVVGYATSSDATTASVQPNASLTLSSNKTYYAITKSEVKTYTATFNLNGASKLTNASGTAVAEAVTRTCNIPVTYNGESQLPSCEITTPTITASTNTPTICGFTTSTTGTSTCTVKHNSTQNLTADIEYYAQTYKAATSKTATFKIASTTKVSKIANSKGNVTNTTDSLTENCNIAATYNGVKQADSCTVTSPTITAATGYKNPFWSTSTSATSGDSSGATLTLTAAATYYAHATISSYSVTYDATTNGGTTTATSKTVNYNAAIDLTPTATKTGYTFKGWNTSSTATTGLTSLKMGTSNVKLYAIFVDETSPKCSWSTSSAIGLNSTAALTLTCEDTGSGITAPPTLAASDFTVTAKGSISSVTGPTTVTASKKYSYTVNVKGISAGTFTVTLPASKVSDGAGNKNAATTSSAVTVNQGTVTPTVNMSGYTYGGTKSTPTISGNTSGGTVTYYYNTTNSNSGGTAWSNVTSATSLNAGTYYMYATVGATADYKAATTAAVAFTIAKANGKVTLSATTGTTTYGTASKTFTVDGNTGGGQLTVSDDNSTATSSISGTTVTIGSLGSLNAATKVVVTVKSAATTNYKEATATYTLTINKANITPTVTMAGYTFAGTKSTPSISGNKGNGTVTYYYSTSNKNSGGTAWSNVTSSSSLAVGTYYMYATVGSTTNYNSATTAAVAFTISGIKRTATFNANGNTLSTPTGCSASGSNRVCSCTTTGTSTSCTITAPTITAPTNTPTIIGFSTAATNRTKSVASGATGVSLSSSPTYYAQTTKAAITYSVTYARDTTTVASLSSTSGSCTIAETYNGTAQAASCNVTLPKVTAAEGYTVDSCPSGYTCSTTPGWYLTAKNGTAVTSSFLKAASATSTTTTYTINRSTYTTSTTFTYTAKARIATASEVSYDNSTSGLTDANGNDCTDVQCAIDSINRMIAFVVPKSLSDIF